MVFKSVPYRVGYGKNFRGRFVDGATALTFKTRDGNVSLVSLYRRAGMVEMISKDKINASTVVLLPSGNILCKKEQEIKSIKNEVSES